MEFLKHRFTQLTLAEKESMVCSYFEGVTHANVRKGHTRRRTRPNTRKGRPLRTDPLTPGLKNDLRKKLHVFTKRQLYDGIVMLNGLLAARRRPPPFPSPTVTDSKNELIDQYLDTVHACWGIGLERRSRRKGGHLLGTARQRKHFWTAMSAFVGSFLLVFTIFWLYKYKSDRNSDEKGPPLRIINRGETRELDDEENRRTAQSKGKIYVVYKYN